ncbi:MAG TPA: FtsX-like permease family protein [Thermoanaerobaculia bacterium]|jgi:lipoprotein-releasing system permease protein
MVQSRIARRYLWAARKRAHTAVLSSISILGLAVGVAALLISIALLSGLQGQIKRRLIASSPQILVEPAELNTIEDYEAIVAEGKRLGMKDVRPLVTGIGYGGNIVEERGRPIRLRSYQAGQEPRADTMRGGTAPLPEGEVAIFVRRDYAASIGLTAGEEIPVIAPRTRLTPFGPMPVIRTYRITRLLPASNEEQAADAMLEMAEASSLLGTNGLPTSIEMYGDTALAADVQTALAAKFPKAVVKTWQEINRPLVLALKLEKIVMFAAISLIIFVAALNLVSSISMLIMEKRPSVGVLRTLGATEREILSIFMQVGVMIGLTGTIIGNILGIGFAWAANRWHLVPLPTDLYFISYLPFELDVQDVVWVNVIAIVLSVLATWYPARIASKLDPITAIKED